MRRLTLVSAAAAASLATLVGVARLSAQEGQQPQKLPPTRGPDAKVFINSATAALVISERPEKEQPIPAERPRGHEKLFEQVAPAVVLVRNHLSSGSGFFVSADGYLVTNFHVVEDDTFIDSKSQASMSRVYLATPGDDGAYRVSDKEYNALVVKVDPIRDLALLRLVELPDGVEKMPFLKIASEDPKIGADVAMLGSPSGGMAFMLRVGEIAQFGNVPDDMLEHVMMRLFAGPADQAKIKSAFADVQRWKIILSTCRANHGDSGGPLVNEKGEVVAATFAGPGSLEDDSFTYHVGGAEIAAFIADKPDDGMLVMADPWRVQPQFEIHDVGGGAAPVLVAGGQNHTQYLVDLDGDTPDGPLRQGDADVLLGQKKFEMEFAFHIDGASARSFYDTDNDGEFDVIMLGSRESGKASIVNRLKGGKWSQELDSGDPLINPELFKDKRARMHLADFQSRL